MTKQNLIDILTEAHEVGAKYIAIKVDTRGFDYPEIVVNYKGNILAKLDYYKRAYNDDLTFLVIPNYYNVLMKVKLGARWFDDIVANNSIRQNAIVTDCEPDYQ